MAQGINSSLRRRSRSARSTNDELQTFSFTRRPRNWTIATPQSVLLTQQRVAGPPRGPNVHGGRVAANNHMVAAGGEGPPSSSSHWADLQGPLVHKIAKLLGNEVDVASMRATTRYLSPSTSAAP